MIMSEPVVLIIMFGVNFTFLLFKLLFNINMDIKEFLVQGLQSELKYLPFWYAYDKQGSMLYYKCTKENKNYYFCRSEISVLAENVEEIVDQITGPCVLVEMGSGDSEKSRMFIDAILEKQMNLKYIPVDISEEFLQEASDAIKADYGDRVEVDPIAGDYTVGIDKLRNILGNKLVIWLGGGFQNQAYNEQVDRIGRLSTVMTENDRLILSLDLTQNTEEIEKAYSGEVSIPLQLNVIWRLNREYGSAIDTDKFELEATFVANSRPDGVGILLLRAKSKCDQSYDIPGLGINVTFRSGEYLRMHEGEGVSCKYTQEQIRTIANSGRQRMDKIWVAKDNHVALCCLASHVIED